jgi:hypothetical protein
MGCVKRFLSILSASTFIWTSLSAVAFACSCAGLEGQTTAREMSKGYVAAIGISVKETLVRTSAGIRTETTYEILDELHGPLLGRVTVYDFEAFSSCSDSVPVGSVTPLVLSKQHGIYTMNACSQVEHEVVADVQRDGRDYVIFGYDLCRVQDRSQNYGSNVRDIPECRLYQHDDSVKSWVAERIEQAVIDAASKYNVSRTNYYGPTNPGIDIDLYQTVADLHQDALVFHGKAVAAELQSDGSTLSTYIVLNDFNQFLPATFKVTDTSAPFSFRDGPLIALSRSEPHTRILYHNDYWSLPTALADWIVNRKDWPINIENCYRDCREGDFNRFSVRSRLLPDSEFETALETVMRRFESLPLD